LVSFSDKTSTLAHPAQVQWFLSLDPSAQQRLSFTDPNSYSQLLFTIQKQNKNRMGENAENAENEENAENAENEENENSHDDESNKSDKPDEIIDQVKHSKPSKHSRPKSTSKSSKSKSSKLDTSDKSSKSGNYKKPHRTFQLPKMDDGNNEAKRKAQTDAGATTRLFSVIGFPS
jgi:hypothetical protein